LIEGVNGGIGKEGWAAAGRALSLKRNFKNLNLGEERGRIIVWGYYSDMTR
jgi:hypothetical protein